MTPHELNLHIEAYRERTDRENENDLVTAYLTAYWQRVKRMPDLKKLLKDNKPKKVQTPEEMLAVVKKEHAKMGGTTG